jgi:PilZ domain
MATPWPPHRRASARARLDGLARVEYGGEMYNFKIENVSAGGLGLAGDAAAFRPGSAVRVIVTMVHGTRLASCPRLQAWAVVRRADPTTLGLAWSPDTAQSAEEILYLVNDAAVAS